MEQRTGDTPTFRLLRLWLWTTPMGMLALAIFFGVLAIDDDDWGLLAAMVLLALVAIALFAAQGRLMRRLKEKGHL